ncbi:MAG: hypothetical protein ACTSQ7_17370, partial [Alphaproteobacteria bacterium]
MDLRVRPTEVRPATAPAGAAPGAAAASPAASPAGPHPLGGDLPADLTMLGLVQLMNLPLRAPQPEQEEEPEVTEDNAEDGETVPE